MRDMIKIPIETVIGSVFIQALEKGITYVPFSVIEDYAREIQKRSNRKIFFYFSRDEVYKAINELGDAFELCDEGIRCNKDVDIEKLRGIYLGWLPLDLAVIFSEIKISF